MSDVCPNLERFAGKETHAGVIDMAILSGTGVGDAWWNGRRGAVRCYVGARRGHRYAGVPPATFRLQAAAHHATEGCRADHPRFAAEPQLSWLRAVGSALDSAVAGPPFDAAGALSAPGRPRGHHDAVVH